MPRRTDDDQNLTRANSPQFELMCKALNDQLGD
jgi:hypothetical protein